MKFTKEKFERAFTVKVGQEGSPHLGITIARKPDEVLIEEDFIFSKLMTIIYK